MGNANFGIIQIHYTFNFWRLRWPKNKNKLYILKRVGMQNAKENEINLRSEIDKKQI